MGKYIYTIACVLLLFSSCRKEADYVPYTGEPGKLAYSTYTEQFEHLWKCVNTAYVFWDRDTVDWDATYERLLPRFMALDRKYQDSGYVRTAELDELYTNMFGKMLDHHMAIVIKNLHPAPGDASKQVTVRPGNDEVKARDYYVESRSAAQSRMKAFLAGIEGQYNVAEHDTAETIVDVSSGRKVWFEYCLFTLDDGRQVPYLWTTSASLSPVMRNMVGSHAQAIIDRWLTVICNTPRSQLAGIILDTRSNNGGYQDDLDYLVGTFLNSRTEIMRTRYKEGPGRMEYSVWSPYYQDPNPNYHRDITAENIPYVVLVDINSVSMAEIEPLIIREVLPTSYVIGERTYGGTGPLQTNSMDLNYGAPFGDATNDYHYVYTSTFEAMIGGKMREGVGIEPDEVVLRKDDPTHSVQPQLDAALRYIRNH